MTTPNLSAEGEKVLEALDAAQEHDHMPTPLHSPECRALLAAHEQRCKAEALEEAAEEMDEWATHYRKTWQRKTSDASRNSARARELAFERAAKIFRVRAALAASGEGEKVSVSAVGEDAATDSPSPSPSAAALRKGSEG